jgi:hypothetical protein
MAQSEVELLDKCCRRDFLRRARGTFHCRSATGCREFVPSGNYFCVVCSEPVIPNLPSEQRWRRCIDAGVKPEEIIRLLQLAHDRFAGSFGEFLGSNPTPATCVYYAHSEDNHRVSHCVDTLAFRLLPGQKAGMRELTRKVLETLVPRERERAWNAEDSDLLAAQLRAVLGGAYTVNKSRMCRKVLATWRRGGGGARGS